MEEVMLLCRQPTGFYSVSANTHFLRSVNFILITFCTPHFLSHKKCLQFQR